MIVFEMFTAFAATLAFAVIFNVSKHELLFCGVAGFTAEGIYHLIGLFFGQNAMAVLIAALAVTILSRCLANIRKVPVTVYLVSGIIPLVPGAGMYSTVYNIISSDYSTAFNVCIDTVKIAAAIAIGIILVFSLPNRLFLKLK